MEPKSRWENTHEVYQEAPTMVGQDASGKCKPYCAESVEVARLGYHQARGGAIPTSALQSIRVSPIAPSVAKIIIVKNHYLGTLPGGTQMSFGVFNGDRLQGALTIGVGPANVHRLVHGADRADCGTLTRLWLSDELPWNSESRVIGIVLRALKNHTEIKFLVSYADPAAGHVGYVYQATNWTYTGLSDATPLYQVGSDHPRHARTVSSRYGTRSAEYFSQQGIELTRIPVEAKHRYLYFLDKSWRSRLAVPVLPYPKMEGSFENT